MSPSLVKMWISFAGMGCMFLSLITIYFSRYKLKGILRMLTAILAYVFMLLAGLMIVLVVFSGPTID